MMVRHLRIRRTILYLALVLSARIATGCAPSVENQERANADDRARSAQLSACRESGQGSRQLMQTNYSAHVERADGWTVVHVGVPLPTENAERWVHLYADADACAEGGPRKLEFQNSSGSVFARADPVRGIRMTN